MDHQTVNQVDSGIFILIFIHLLGAIKMVMDKQANMTLGYFTTTATRNWFMTSSYVYYSSNMIWVVPPGRLTTSLEKLLHPFQVSVWIMFLITLILSFLFVAIVSRLSKIAHDFWFGRGIASPSLNIVNLTLVGSLNKLPKRHFARVVLVFFMFYCFLIQNSYKGELFKFMRMPSYDPEAQSVDEMIARGFHFYILKSSREQLAQMPKVLSRGHFMTPAEFYASFDNVLDSEFKGAFMSSKDHIAYKNLVKGKYYRHASEVIATYNIVIYMHKQSCLAKEIDQKVINLANGGIIRQWASKFTDAMYFSQKTKSKTVALNLKQLSGAFQLLLAGLVVSVITFSLEIITIKIKSFRMKS